LNNTKNIIYKNVFNSPNIINNFNKLQLSNDDKFKNNIEESLLITSDNITDDIKKNLIYIKNCIKDKKSYNDFFNSLKNKNYTSKNYVTNIFFAESLNKKYLYNYYNYKYLSNIFSIGDKYNINFNKDLKSLHNNNIYQDITKIYLLLITSWKRNYMTYNNIYNIFNKNLKNNNNCYYYNIINNNFDINNSSDKLYKYQNEYRKKILSTFKNNLILKNIHYANYNFMSNFIELINNNENSLYIYYKTYYENENDKNIYTTSDYLRYCFIIDNDFFIKNSLSIKNYKKYNSNKFNNNNLSNYLINFNDKHNNDTIIYVFDDNKLVNILTYNNITNALSFYIIDIYNEYIINKINNNNKLVSYFNNLEKIYQKNNNITDYIFDQQKLTKRNLSNSNIILDNII